MTAVTVCSDFKAQEEKNLSLLLPFPYLLWSNGAKCPDLHLIFSFKPGVSSLSSLSAIGVVSFAYLRLLIFLPLILIPACNSSSLAFLMMCLAYRLNKQGDSRQPFDTPFLILNQSVFPYRVLTVAAWPAYRFLRRQVRSSGISISWRTFHSLLWSTQS